MQSDEMAFGNFATPSCAGRRKSHAVVDAPRCERDSPILPERLERGRHHRTTTLE
jgi:hypothetical protein